MDETLWRDGADPAAILDAIEGRADPRRLRLFACACCRQIWGRLDDARARWAVETAERFADGDATAEELRAAYWRAAPSARAGEAPWACVWAATKRDINAARAAARGTRLTSSQGRSWLERGLGMGVEPAVQVALLRDLFGAPPVLPAVDPTWLEWRGGTVVQLAEAIYAEHRFDGLAVLGDALEEAGCTEAALLDHCREPGPHARGCWVIDLLLGKK